MKNRWHFLRQNVAPALVILGLAWVIAWAGWLDRAENNALDFRVRVRARTQAPADARQVVIGIDDESIAGLGRWPWSRRVHGQFLYWIGNEKPAVVGWDILFVEASEDDNALAAGIKKSGVPVILGAVQEEKTDVDPEDEKRPDLTRPFLRVEGETGKIPGGDTDSRPVPVARAVSLSGYVNTPPGVDGFRRVVPLLTRIKGKVYASLSLQCLLSYWHVAPAEVLVRLGDGIYFPAEGGERRIPIDEGGGYFVNYRYSKQTANTDGFYSVFNWLNKKYREKTDGGLAHPVAGKILLVGQMSTGLSDNGVTPFGGEDALVMVHANVIDNVLKQDYAKRVPAWPVFLAGLALGVVSLAYIAHRKNRDQVIFALAVPGAYFLVALLAWNRWSLWLPLAWPVLGFGSIQIFVIAQRMLAAQRAKEQIKGMFGTYVSPEVVNRMVDAGVSPQLGGHEEEITAYFSDIQGFSTFSEKLPPDRLVELMNEYLTVCTDIVQEEGGTLDKYIGDAIVAMFGAPIPLTDHAFRACVATLRVQTQLGELRTKWQAEGDKWPPIVGRMQSRIGLNSGRAIIGNMGSRTRFNYTMMGDNVNLAARMESGAKSWGAYTMCSDATREACLKHGGDRVVFRPLGRIVVKGRSTAVPIFEITGLKETLPEAARECIGRFEEGLAKYYARDWDAALALFERSRALEPNQPGQTPGVTSNPSLVYLDIVQGYKVEPPAADWDGTYHMTEK